MTPERTCVLTESEKLETTGERLPSWFRSSTGKREAAETLSQNLNAEIPNTICQEARCPNRSECWSKGLLTFMILGTICTRRCQFCSVKFGKPLPPDTADLAHILNAIEQLNLRFVVLTSPNRDDLPDGGAGHYAFIVSEIKKRYQNRVKVEVLIPDFKGQAAPLATVIESGPDVINHNLETVPSLYRIARKGSLYTRSLDVLSAVKAKDPNRLTKTGVMLGLGETEDELIQTFRDIRDRNIDILTLGQYLKPDRNSLPIARYYHPKEFVYYKDIATDLGIRHVFSGPLVRSSYLAEHVFDALN
jgi:lipoic acid synthetase